MPTCSARVPKVGRPLGCCSDCHATKGEAHSDGCRIWQASVRDEMSEGEQK